MDSWVPKSWEDAEKLLGELKPEVEQTITRSQADIGRYPKMNDNGEHLSQLLANLNWYVQKLGELHARAEALKTWTEKRYEIEKGLELDRLVKVEKMSASQAGGSKYVKVKEYLDPMVRASAMHLRVQNARSSARDTTEAIRSRIGQLRGQLRNS